MKVFEKKDKYKENRKFNSEKCNIQYKNLLLKKKVGNIGAVNVSLMKLFAG